MAPIEQLSDKAYKRWTVDLVGMRQISIHETTDLESTLQLMVHSL